MIPNRVLFYGLCLATLVSPQALKSQTHLTMESFVLNTHSQTADFTLMLQSKDLDWKAAGNGKSKADLILVTTSLDKKGDILFWSRESLTITADTEDAVKLATANRRVSAKVNIPVKTNKVRFLVQAANDREIGAFEVDRKTIYAALEDAPAPPCRARGPCSAVY
jgi:hypothetical protein